MPMTLKLFVKPSPDQKHVSPVSKVKSNKPYYCLYRIRQGAIKDRTARINRLRGLLAEFGIIMPKLTIYQLF